MNQSKISPEPGRTGFRQFGLVLLCLLVLLGFLFRDGWLPGRTVFSNDGPLGVISWKGESSYQSLFGSWQNLNWIGGAGPSASPTVSIFIGLVSGPLVFSKIFAPFALLFLGLSAWFCFRQWKLSPAACLLGGIAAALNSDFFSTACWGVAAQPLSFGLDFLALAALADQTSPRRWLRVALAGLAVGMGVMESFDIGAIFSMVIGGFVVFQALFGEGTASQRLIRGLVRLAIVVVLAAAIAAATVVTLVGTQIKGVAGAQQDQETKWGQWDWATQWSLPKVETLSLIVPGLFGYRMDTPVGLPEGLQDHYRGGNYWGACGRDPSWDRYFRGGPLREGDNIRITFASSPNLNASQAVQGDGKIMVPTVGEVKAAGMTTQQLQDMLVQKHPQLASNGFSIAMGAPGGFIRYGGGGLYTGVLVVLIAFWAVLQALRKQDSVFPLPERRFIWFWSVLGLFCVLLGFGRFAPFYQLFYALPYASTIRNPSKFFHVVEWVLVILFAYGVHGLSRLCLDVPGAGTRGLSAQLRTWWTKAAPFDRNWVKGSVVALCLGLVAWLVYSASRDRLVAHLQTVQFDPAIGGEIANFSIRQAGWFLVFLALSLGLVIVAVSGYFGGRRLRLGVILVGLLLVADLGRANLPWVITWNWKQKYAANPVIDLLREKPYEQRVAILPFRAPKQFALLNDLYDIEWKQHLFQYYNIQSLDIIMMPRMAVDFKAFEGAMYFDGTSNTLHHLTRRWQLTNTRYLLGAAGFLQVLNEQIDPAQHRFRIATRFDITGKPDVTNPNRLDELTAVINPSGQYALFEFTGALPRAKLYANWQVSTNDQVVLANLANAAFDPAQTVMVSNPLPAPTASAPTNQNPGTVAITGYAPKRIVLQAEATRPAVLLLNDRFDPNWKVSVDGKPEAVLRCNYLMRGVYLQAGRHSVEFRFAPPVNALYVSLAAVGVGLLLLGFLWFGRRAEAASVDAPQPLAKSGSGG